MGPANVVIADGVIAGVGPRRYAANCQLDVTGQFLVPGLMDSHIHIESTLLTPGEFARLVTRHGTTTVIADPHEIANVMGLAGVRAMVAASRGLPVDIAYMAPSCVPCLAWEQAGAVVDPADVGALLADAVVLGLAEVMDFPAVLGGGSGGANEADKLAKMALTARRGGRLDGHAPGLLGDDLVAYAAAGPTSDHECTTLAEAVARADLGLLVQIREGSVARNLEALMPGIIGGSLPHGTWTLCTDDITPDELCRAGHIDTLLARLVAGGVDPVTAVTHATLVPARHYGLTDRGLIAPGRRADLAVLADRHTFAVTTTIKDGRQTWHNGQLDPRAMPATVTAMPADSTVRLPPGGLDATALVCPLASATVPVMAVRDGQIVTEAQTHTVARDDAGRWRFDPTADIALAVAVERHRGTGNVGVGLARGFGLRRGTALASTVAHDSHNIVAVGTDPADLAVAVRALADMGGGFVVVAGRQVRAALALPVAGLLSPRLGTTVAAELSAVNAAAAQVGCPLRQPFGTLSFIGLPVIPQLRITSRGLFDVTRMAFVSLSP